MRNWETVLRTALIALSAIPEVMLVVSIVNLIRAKRKKKAGDEVGEYLFEKWRGRLGWSIILLIVIVIAIIVLSVKIRREIDFCNSFYNRLGM